MTTTETIDRICRREGHGAFVARPKGRNADADRCGTWYECPVCGVVGDSVLVPSPELTAQIAAQQKAASVHQLPLVAVVAKKRARAR